MNHTQIPWEVGVSRLTRNHPTRFWETAVLSSGVGIICFAKGETRAEAEANAAHIVRCVNSHEILIKALNGARDALLASSDIDDHVEAALKDVESALAEAQR